jgi:hypothetical protein
MVEPPGRLKDGVALLRTMLRVYIENGCAPFIFVSDVVITVIKSNVSRTSNRTGGFFPQLIDFIMKLCTLMGKFLGRVVRLHIYKGKWRMLRRTIIVNNTLKRVHTLI